MAIMIRDIIKDADKLEVIAEGIKPDANKRIHFPKGSLKPGMIYHIYSNTSGQIILDPQAVIPASELWVFQNEDILTALDESMAQSKIGQRVNRGSFAQYIEDEA